MHKLCQKTKGAVVLPIEGTGEETRAFVFIDDLIAELMKVMEKGEHLGIYNIGAENEMSIKQLAKEIARFFARDVRIASRELKPAGTVRLWPSIKRIRDLDYAPTVSLKQELSAS